LQETDALQGLDFEPHCGVRVAEGKRFLWWTITLSNPGNCGEVATALMTCTACEHVALICTHHQDEIYSFKRVFCTFCGAKGDPRDLVKFSPIGGHS
jgi:hypothetical protein